METEIKSAVDEVQCLQSCINDLIGVQALAAFWSVQEPSQIVGTLLKCWSYSAVGLRLCPSLRFDWWFADRSGSPGSVPNSTRSSTTGWSNTREVAQGSANRPIVIRGELIR